MEYTLEKEKGNNMLTIKDDLGIEQAQELKAVLLESIEEADHLYVNLEGTTQIDMTCAQIFCAANKSCEKKGVRLQQTQSAAHIRNTLVKLGYDNHREYSFAPCAKCFWKGEQKNG